MKIRIIPAAIEDLERGHAFYERQAEGLGDYFLDSLFSDIDSLILYAGIHSKAFGFHRLLSHRFPFLIYYLFEGTEVVVYAVLDGRRRPSTVRRRLKRRS